MKKLARLAEGKRQKQATRERKESEKLASQQRQADASQGDGTDSIAEQDDDNNENNISNFMMSTAMETWDSIKGLGHSVVDRMMGRTRQTPIDPSKVPRPVRLGRFIKPI